MQKCRPVLRVFFVTDSQLHLHPQTARLMLDNTVEPCQPTHLLRERGAGHQLLGAVASRRSARCGPPSAECPHMTLSHPGLVAGDQLLGVVLQDAARAVVLQRRQHQPVVYLRQGHLLHPEGDLPQQVRRRSDRCVSQRCVGQPSCARFHDAACQCLDSASNCESVHLRAERVTLRSTCHRL